MPSLILRVPRPVLHLRRWVVQWPPSLGLWQAEQVLLFLLPLTGVLGLSVLPTWRIVNVLYVALGLATLRWSKGTPWARNLLYCQLFFLFMVGLQYLNKGPDYAWSFYDISWVSSVVLLFAFSQLFFLRVQSRLEGMLKVFELLALVNILYQLYQQVMFQLKWYGLATVLNEQNITYGNTFFKLIGKLMGSPGFMAEAGHLALFIAPLIGFQLVADYYGVLPLNRKRIIIMGTSLALTISSGAFLQFAFLAVLQLLIIRRNFTVRQLRNVVLLIAGVAITVMTFDAYREAILYRVYSVFELDSGRFMGAKVFWGIFTENTWFGIGPKAARFSGADPNFFITSVLADHGLLAGIPLFICYFLPVALAYYKSDRKLFIVPYLAMTLHLFLAYGTFTWSFIWMHIALTIWGLAYSKTWANGEPNQSMTTFSQLRKS